MTAASAFTPVPAPGSVRQFFWQWPEWWTYGLCGLGWWAMLLHGWQHAAHGIHHWMSYWEEVQSWMLMVFAMMLPLIRHAIRATAFASLWARRHRAMAGFVLGYAAPWLAMGMAVALLRGEAFTHTYAAAMVAFLLAAAWQLTPMHALALTACHRVMPLAPMGWRADRDCFHFGCRMGLACLWSCWPLMLACAFTGHALIAMAGGMALGVIERWTFRPLTGVVAVGTLLLAGYYALIMGVHHFG